MIIKNNGDLSIQKFSIYSTKNNTYYYSGLIWTPGILSGLDTVKYLDQIYTEKSIIPFNSLLGAFIIVIVSSKNEVIAFTDNSNMRSIYYNDNSVSSSLLEIAKHCSSSVNDRYAVEYLLNGNISFGKTLFYEIKNIRYSEYIVVKNMKIAIIDKGIGDITKKSMFNDINDFFDNLAYSIKNRRVTLSLTGGYDSRMVYACLYKKVKVSPFISGDNLKNPDLIYAKKVAKSVDDSLEIISMGKPEISTDAISKLLKFSDCTQEYLKDGFIRVFDFLEKRKQSDFDLYISGDGGPRHKDWYWIQDWPFYNKKKTNLDKFYKQRIELVHVDYPLSDQYQKHTGIIKSDIINNLKKITKETNTKSYDSFGFEMLGYTNKMIYNNFSKVIDSYAPLWEIELVRHSYNLPRKKRIRNYSMRDATTKASKEIAKIRTVYGPSASTEYKFLFQDTFLWGVDYIKKVIRLFSRKIIKKSLFVTNPTTWSIKTDIYKNPYLKEAILYAKKKNYIDNDVDYKELPSSLVTRIVELYLINAELTKGK